MPQSPNVLPSYPSRRALRLAREARLAEAEAHDAAEAHDTAEAHDAADESNLSPEIQEVPVVVQEVAAAAEAPVASDVPVTAATPVISEAIAASAAATSAETSDLPARHDPNVMPSEFMTPIHTFVPVHTFTPNASGTKTNLSAPKTAKGARKRVKRGPKRILAAAFASACVATLSFTFVMPLFGSLSGGPDALATAAALPGQQLYSGNVEENTDAIDAIGAVTLEIDPKSGQPVLTEHGLVEPETLDNTKLRMPFDHDWPLTDGFGYRVVPVEQFHDAQDFAAPSGTPILAIGSGVVIEAGWDSDGCGFGLKLQHKVDGNVLTSRYCHLLSGSHAYSVGDRVELGEEIGQVGNTGLSFGPHLHLALRLDGVQIDPIPYIQSKPQLEPEVKDKQ